MLWRGNLLSSVVCGLAMLFYSPCFVLKSVCVLYWSFCLLPLWFPFHWFVQQFLHSHLILLLGSVRACGVWLVTPETLVLHLVLLWEVHSQLWCIYLICNMMQIWIWILAERLSETSHFGVMALHPFCAIFSENQNRTRWFSSLLVQCKSWQCWISCQQQIWSRFPGQFEWLYILIHWPYSTDYWLFESHKSSEAWNIFICFQQLEMCILSGSRPLEFFQSRMVGEMFTRGIVYSHCIFHWWPHCF